MKRVLIVGEHSYIGQAFAKYADTAFDIDFVSGRADNWKSRDFSGYDAVLHCAAIVHQRQRADMRDLYFNVNRDLTAAIAEKAKAANVRQFVFLSTMSVYGISEGVITGETLPKPGTDDFYAQSKYGAEKILETLADENFKIAIVRPPMVYGDGCKGNYRKLRKLVGVLPVFPKIDNRRSMIHIDKLSEFLSELINETSCGIFRPQDDEYVCTYKMAQAIASEAGKTLRLTSAFNGIIKASMPVIPQLRKLFGDLVYA
jgi:UDP-glucose 4-epimerase